MKTMLEIRFSGSGGQGLILAAGMLSDAFVAEGRTVAQSQSYEPTSRGGLSRSDLVVADGPVDYPLVSALDYLVILDQVAAAESKTLIHDAAIVITDNKTVSDPPSGNFTLVNLPIAETAIQLGNRRVANIIALASLSALGSLCNRDTLETIVANCSPRAFVDLNRNAFAKGWDMVQTG